MNHLERDEFKTLLRHINKPEYRLMLLVGFHHGLRVSELINLTGGSIRDGYVTVRRLKGSLPTNQPYVSHPDPELDEAKGLEEMARTHKKNERLWPITRDAVNKMILRAGAAANLPRHKCHPHVLKHSIAVQSIGKVGIENARAHLGHKSIASTGAYLKVDPEKASRAVAAAI